MFKVSGLTARVGIFDPSLSSVLAVVGNQLLAGKLMFELVRFDYDYLGLSTETLSHRWSWALLNALLTLSSFLPSLLLTLDHFIPITQL